MFRMGKFAETKNRSVTARAGGGENGYTISFWADENVLKLDAGDGCATFSIY